MKFAICQEMFVDWDWNRQCEFIAKTGYTGIELAPFTLASRIGEVSSETRQEMRKTSEDHGLEIMGLHWLLAKTEGFHLTTSDPAVREATANYLIELGNACADFGGTLMVFGSPFQRDIEEGMPAEQAYENATEIFKKALPAFRDRGVEICMEPLTEKETNFINSCAEADKLIKMVGEPNLTLHQDVKAIVGAEAETESVPELIHKYAGQVGHFHVNDTNLLGPGMGEIDYKPILKALTEVNYSKWISVEVFDYSPGAERIAKESLSYMKDILSEIDSNQ